MIPVSLRLRNFMCYRENAPVLSFEGIHVACICGDNGNGKSALIDAMTWALWGKARAKSDDDLIYQNQSEMQVEFDFTIASQLYRIVRRHARPKKQNAAGHSSLDLFVSSGNGFQPISGDTIAQTQQKIIDILHMDYDTFINSSYLRQGHADEFTRQPPAKRKEVLAGILQLSAYDQFEGQAKELARQGETTRGQLESLIQSMGEELSQKPGYEAELTRIYQQLSQLEVAVIEKEERVKNLRTEREVLDGKRTQLTQLDRHIAEKETELVRWRAQAEQHLSRLKDYEALLAQRSAIEKGYALLTEARKWRTELDQKFHQVYSLTDKKGKLELAVARVEEALASERAIARSRTKELGQKAQKLTQFRTGLEIVQQALLRLPEKGQTLRNKRQAILEWQTRLGYLESTRARLGQEISEIEEKLGLLATQTEAKCPLCEADLGEESRQRIETKYAAEKQGKHGSMRQTETEIQQLRKAISEASSEISRLEIEFNEEMESLTAKEALLKREIQEAETASTQLETETKRLLEIEARLNSKDFAPAEREALRGVEGELAGLGYDASQHERVRKQVAELEKYEELKRRLADAENSMPRERDAAARAEEFARQLEQGIVTDKRTSEALDHELKALPDLAASLAQADSEYQTAKSGLSQTQQALGSIKARLERCAELELRKKEKEGVLAQTLKEITIYKTLAEAFGKRGIQAWLIEQVVPEITAEANRLLSRMTDSRMQVKIASHRQTKKAEGAQTLDIDIADELGTRKYEMFSGGEAFRIDFAIRIAISKLLARRAGAPLPILIIDEGFGTQDSSGIERLVEAINSIQNDFDKILVITHIDELKDAFPTRITVTKSGDGSTLSVE